MMNFDFENLLLINPCKIDDECYKRAVHAQKIIEKAQIYPSFEEVVKNIDYLIATSSIESKNDRKHLRNSYLIENLSEKIFEIEGKIGLVFGREDYGLYNNEIALCDIMVKIPSSESYPSLNLSHAVNIVLYSIYIRNIYQPKKKRIIGKTEKEKLFSFFYNILDEIDYPKHKIENTNLMFKRIMGRAMPSKWEFHTLMGVLSKTLEKIRNNK